MRKRGNEPERRRLPVSMGLTLDLTPYNLRSNPFPKPSSQTALVRGPKPAADVELTILPTRSDNRIQGLLLEAQVYGGRSNRD